MGVVPEEGDRAPDFTLAGLSPEGEEVEVSLSQFLGGEKMVVLYFYPKDNTSGCTTEACDFRDNMNRVSSRAVVLGVSPDSIRSHMRFREKHGLNFYLLSDPEKSVMESYGAFGEKKMYGKVVKGVIRSTFIIAPDGTIVKAWRKVRAKGHVDKVLQELDRLSGS